MKKPYANMTWKCHHCLWAKAHLKQTRAMWKTVAWSLKSKFEILFGKHGHHIFWTKEKRIFNHRFYHRAPLVIWGYISAHGTGSLYMRKGTSCTESYTPVLEQHILTFKLGKLIAYFSRNAEPHTASITTKWLHSTHNRKLIMY